jgi:hypothetical protein
MLAGLAARTMGRLDQAIVQQHLTAHPFKVEALVQVRRSIPAHIPQRPEEALRSGRVVEVVVDLH